MHVNKIESTMLQAITLNRCYRFQIKGYTSINPARSHITLTSCKKGIISNIRLIAPGESPNTDGIDISASRDIQVLNSFIATGNVFNSFQSILLLLICIYLIMLIVGDDCIAISAGSSVIKITAITCGPGHGIRLVLSECLNFDYF